MKREISKKYNVLTEDGVALRGLFIVDKEVCVTGTNVIGLAVVVLSRL